MSENFESEDFEGTDWPPERSAGKASKKYRDIMLGLLTLAAVATAGLLATLTYYTVSDHRAAAETAAEAKRLEVDKTALAVQVTGGLQSMLDSDEAMRDYGIQFGQDLTLFQLVADGSEYRGLVTAFTKKATEVPVMVTVYADGTGPLFYQMDPASNLRLNQTASEEQPKECTGYYGC
jgi:hypothetical protein